MKPAHGICERCDAETSAAYEWHQPGFQRMRLITPIARRPVGSQGFDLLVERDLANPFAPGEIITDGQQRYKVVGIEGSGRPDEVNLLVSRVSD